MLVNQRPKHPGISLKSMLLRETVSVGKALQALGTRCFTDPRFKELGESRNQAFFNLSARMHKSNVNMVKKAANTF